MRISRLAGNQGNPDCPRMTAAPRRASGVTREVIRRAIVHACTACALATPAHASPLDLFGFGGRSPGMAGAGVATATDFDAVYLNPAGLADTAGKRISLGGMGAGLRLAIDGDDIGADPALGLVIGGAVRLPLGGALRDRVGLGLGIHVPHSTINRARHPLPGAPVFALLEHRSHVVGLQVAAGVALDARWRVGLGVLALAELRGRIDVTTDAAGRFTSFSEQRLLTRVAPIAGVRYALSERVHLGAVVRGTSRSDYDIQVTNDLENTLPVTIPPIRVAGVAQYDPLTVAVEGAVRVRPGLAISGQVAYQRWSAFPLPTQNPVAGTPPQEPPGFHDIPVPRVAVEWTRRLGRTALALRAGYGFLLSPAPEMRGRQSLLDNHRHVLAGGVGLSRAGLPVHLGAWAQLHALMPRRHTKDPARFDAGEALPFDSIRTGGRILAAGLTVGLDL